MPVVDFGVDNSGSVIPSVNVNPSYVRGFSFTVRGWLSKTYEFPNGIACCGIISPYGVTGNAGIPYAGYSSDSERFVAHVSGFPAALPVTLATLPAPTPFAPLLVQGYNGLEQFVATAQGNVSPARVYFPRQRFLVGEGVDGSYWVDGAHYSNYGVPLGTIAASGYVIAEDYAGHVYSLNQDRRPACAIFEYPRAPYGHVAPLREIQFACPEGAGAVAVDHAGNVFASTNGVSGATIIEFAPGTASGYVTPTQQLAIPNTFEIASMDTDGADNLYALATNAGYHLYKIAPGLSALQPLLTSIPLGEAIALDDAGNLYVVRTGTGSPRPPDQVEEYAPGASIPTRTLSGTDTLILSVYFLAVPRAGH